MARHFIDCRDEAFFLRNILRNCQDYLEHCSEILMSRRRITIVHGNRKANHVQGSYTTMGRANWTKCSYGEGSDIKLPVAADRKNG